MDIINYVSIFFEAVVVVVSLMIAIGKKQCYGCALALTFAIYVFYDLVRVQGWEISGSIMELSFFVATISAVVAVYSIYKKLN